MSDEAKEPTFEESMQKLERIVQKLEQGDVPLEEAITMFQEGVALSNDCHTRLTKVETKMAEILDQNGGRSEFSPEEES